MIIETTKLRVPNLLHTTEVMGGSEERKRERMCCSIIINISGIL